MTRIYTTTHIRKPVEEVFDYVTTPANWPRWHPSSLSVSGSTGSPRSGSTGSPRSGAADHSLHPGEQVTEEFLVAGRRGSVVWTVREREAPHRWVIEGQVEGGGGGTITYALSPDGGGTHFEREFIYTMPNPLLALLDRLIFRRRVGAESAEALRRLKKELESRKN